MSRIIFTGDIHGSLEAKRLSYKNFPEGRNLTKNDYVIICGDFGCVWDGSNCDKYWLDWLEDRPFTTLFVDGNHENFNLLYNWKIPIEDNWHGGNVRVIRPSVLHLMRGQIFTINNMTFFTMGGATSTDKYRRKENVSWWPQEIPSYIEMEYGVNNLNEHNNKVDYIITHCLPNSILDRIDKWCPQHDSLTNYLEKMIVQNIDFKKWFCGHYHIDRTIDDKYYICYKDFLELLPNGEIKLINNYSGQMVEFNNE